MELISVADDRVAGVFQSFLRASACEMPPDPFQVPSLDCFQWVIESDGEFVGYVTLHSIDWISRRGRTGTWITPDKRGRGLVTGARVLLHKKAVEEFNLRRIDCAVESSNTAQKRVMEKFGMVLEGEVKEAVFFMGAYRTFSLYALFLEGN